METRSGTGAAIRKPRERQSAPVASVDRIVATTRWALWAAQPSVHFPRKRAARRIGSKTKPSSLRPNWATFHLLALRRFERIKKPLKRLGQGGQSANWRKIRR